MATKTKIRDRDKASKHLKVNLSNVKLSFHAITGCEGTKRHEQSYFVVEILALLNTIILTMNRKLKPELRRLKKENFKFKAWQDLVLKKREEKKRETERRNVNTKSHQFSGRANRGILNIVLRSSKQKLM